MKSMLIKALPLIFSFLLSQAFADETFVDPFASVEHIKYDNGLEVFLSPSYQATNMALRLEVLVGWEAEKPHNWGVSHLLEHVLFRDKQLKDEMSYLQLIREAGGEANGSTSSRKTSYYGTIPYRKGTWLLKNVTKMILEPSIEPDYVQKEKSTVELEIGKPGPITVFLGFNPMDYLYPRYLQTSDFWKSEFHVSFKTPYTNSEEQLSNQRLTHEQVKKHYTEYYYPANMRLYVAGRYNREEILDLIQKKWATLPARQGEVLPQEPTPKPAQRPYRRIAVFDGSGFVHLGTKLWDVSAKENEVVASYMSYLAHRLMKEVRNLKGQTYTAQSTTETSSGYGYSIVQIQTPEENLAENTQLIRKHLESEARLGQLTAEQVKEAVDLYLASYRRMGQEAQDRMWLATEYESIKKLHGQFTSPYESLYETTPEEYNEILKKYFTKSAEYEYIYQPYLVFPYDIYILYFISALFSFTFFRRKLTKKFDHDQLHWVRKLKFPPGKLLEVAVLSASYFIFVHIHHWINEVIQHPFFQTHIVISQYIPTVVWTFMLILTIQGVISMLPRKLMVMNDKLVIKSVTYYSKHIDLNQIVDIRCVSLLSKELGLVMLKKNWKFRLFYFNPKFWQKGLLIETQNGRAYFFGVSETEKVQSELSRFVPNLHPLKAVA